jgi:Tfp pilus assembly protein PilV
MSVEHAPEDVGSLESTQRKNRGLTIAVAVLTVITLGLAGWLAYLLVVPEENAVSSDVAQVLEDYTDAWNNYDGAAFMGLVTADYKFYEAAGQPAEDAEGTAAMISNDLEGFDWAVEQQGAAQMIGDEYTVHVSSLDVTSTNVGPDNEGVSVLTLVNQDGVWKVKQHIFDGR